MNLFLEKFGMNNNHATSFVYLAFLQNKHNNQFFDTSEKVKFWNKGIFHCVRDMAASGTR